MIYDIRVIEGADIPSQEESKFIVRLSASLLDEPKETEIASSNPPNWDSSEFNFEYLSKDDAELEVTLLNGEKEIGKSTLPLSDIESGKETDKWAELKATDGSDAGRIHLSIKAEEKEQDLDDILNQLDDELEVEIPEFNKDGLENKEFQSKLQKSDKKDSNDNFDINLDEIIDGSKNSSDDNLIKRTCVAVTVIDVKNADQIPQIASNIESAELYCTLSCSENNRTVKTKSIKDPSTSSWNQLFKFRVNDASSAKIVATLYSANEDTQNEEIAKGEFSIDDIIEKKNITVDLQSTQNQSDSAQLEISIENIPEDEYKEEEEKQEIIEKSLPQTLEANEEVQIDEPQNEQIETHDEQQEQVETHEEEQNQIETHDEKEQQEQIETHEEEQNQIETHEEEQNQIETHDEVDHQEPIETHEEEQLELLDEQPEEEQIELLDEQLEEEKVEQKETHEEEEQQHQIETHEEEQLELLDEQLEEEKLEQIETHKEEEEQQHQIETHEEEQIETHEEEQIETHEEEKIETHEEEKIETHEEEQIETHEEEQIEIHEEEEQKEQIETYKEEQNQIETHNEEEQQQYQIETHDEPQNEEDEPQQYFEDDQLENENEDENQLVYGEEDYEEDHYNEANAQTSPSSSPRPRTKEEKYDHSLKKLLIEVHNLDKEDAEKEKEEVYEFVKSRADEFYQSKVITPIERNEETSRKIVLKLTKNNEELEKLNERRSKPENMSPKKLKREIKKLEKEIQDLDIDIDNLTNENDELANIIFELQNQINNA